MANGEQSPTAAATPPLGTEVQANFGRVARFADGSTRNWMLFFFFRILPQAEVEADAEQLVALIAALLSNKPDAALEAAMAMQASLEHQVATHARRGDQAQQDNQAAATAPSRLFFDWLKLVTAADAATIASTLDQLLRDAGLDASIPAIADTLPQHQGPFHRLFDTLVLPHLPDHGRALETFGELIKIARAVPGTLFRAGGLRAALSELGDDAADAGLMALAGGLPKVCLYEVLRQVAPAHVDAAGDALRPGLVRSEAAHENVAPRRGGGKAGWDTTPINIAFTYPGLSALQLDPATLASFPSVFKEGMAARAAMLGDTGPSAPENWDGVLGLNSVHGYFTGGFMVGNQDLKVPASHWQALRDDVQAFNTRAGERGRFLRFLLGALYRLFGMEILHIELGEDPHEVGDDGNTRMLEYRQEHFGFRDGISQPFVDLQLGNPPPGDGTPSRNRTWAPVAAGEIYLDQPDEDGAVHALPIHPLLRQGSTFLVFRKLEQDVAGFRMFLAKQRPGSRTAQHKLAAQFFGRWPSGTPLILAPDEPMDLGSDPDWRINDFLYAADDPDGLRCPLAAHSRRSNPRDIGGTDGVRRHRILRRAISYGGPLLPEGSLGDGKRRGLLFVAANSRIDVQFELIQSRWLNRGEVLGQVGLNRCPITGANSGGPQDAFLEAGAIAPVTGIPRFVITRGGDYFFLPGLSALRAMGAGCKFKVDAAALPFLGYSMGDAVTPSLFDVDRLTGYANRILAGGPPVVRVAMPQPNPPQDPISSTVAFVARLDDVKHVLSMKLGPTNAPEPDRKILNSVAMYHRTVERISRGQDMLVSTELGAVTEDRRKRLSAILNAAWLGLGKDIYARLARITSQNIEAALRRAGPSGRIDLVYDLASVTVYDILIKLFGTPGPAWLTELAVALPFAQQHITSMPPDWLTAAHLQQPDNPALTSLQVWSVLIMADTVGNVVQQDEIWPLSNQAASEILTHLDSLIATARTQTLPATTHLLASLVAHEDQFVHLFGYTAQDYYADVRMLLMETVGSAIANIPAAFGVIVGTLLDYNLPLTDLMPILLAAPKFPLPDQSTEGEDGVGRLVYETARLNGQLKLLMRHCMQDQDLPSGGKLHKGEWVGAILAAASIDPAAFAEPLRFSLRPFLPGPERKIENYLLFGAAGGGRECWGRDRLALFCLKEFIKASARLQLLQKVAGPAGAPKQLVQLTIGLPARFTAVLPNWPAPPTP